jgi:hypothetical protein
MGRAKKNPDERGARLLVAEERERPDDAAVPRPSGRRRPLEEGAVAGATDLRVAAVSAGKV